jgi:Zn-dependent protease
LDRCAVCGAEEFIPYVCRYCGGVHCVYHRLPENHECPNIEQARAPRPILRAEKRVPASGMRLLKAPRISTISPNELKALAIALLALGLSFSVRYMPPLQPYSFPQFVEIFLLTLVVVGIGFLGHELAHKFTAERYGCWAEFKLWTYGALMSLLFAVVSLGTFVFAAPGAVYIASRSGYFGEGLDRKTNGVVSIMGPLVNIGAALAFLGGYVAAALVNLPVNVGSFNFLQQGIEVNLWLGAFNMLPIFILDGQKVFAWDRRIWAALTVPMWIAAFAVRMFL